jgi:diguanylate cyclase
MFTQEMSSIIFVGVWSLTSVGVGLISGFLIGRLYTLGNEPRKIKKNREATMSALVEVMNSTHQLNEDVDVHNVSLQTAKKELENIETDTPFESLQTTLADNIVRVVSSNRRLENDLLLSRFKLENQAQEIDRTRLEARTDALCSVGNRKAVDENLQFRLSRYVNKGNSFGLMLIDIDHFKRINDTFGHKAGDEVLRSIALALQECVRPKDFVGRLGGDEFVLIIEELTEDTTELVGKRIRAAIELYDFSINSLGQSTVVTMSMGLSVIAPGDTVASLYERADRALYKSKQLGRNRLCSITERTLNSTAEAASLSNVTGAISYEAFKASFADTNPLD